MRDEHLLEFYGEECVHCKHMEPLLEMLEEELGVKVRRLEVWHNEANRRLMEKYDQGKCGGTPFFYNTRTGGWICGAADYEKLKKWAMGE